MAIPEVTFAFNPRDELTTAALEGTERGDEAPSPLRYVADDQSASKNVARSSPLTK